MSGDTADWSLVTVTHNSARQLSECWAEASIGDAEWVVVDNASTDDSLEIAEKLGARVVALTDNRGFAHANNAGLETVSTPWVAFVNPDVTVPDASGLERLAETARSTGGLVAPQLLNPDGSEQPNARGLPFMVDKLANRSVRLPGSRLEDYARTGLTRPTYVGWVMGAALGGPTELLRELGGWDDGFFLYYEDHDIGLRAWSAGHSVVLDPAVRWTHQWQRATTRLSLRPWRWEWDAGRRFYSRYPELVSRHRFRRSGRTYGALTSRLWQPVDELTNDDATSDTGIVVPLFEPDPASVANIRAMADQAPVVAVDDGSCAAEAVLRHIEAIDGVTLIRRESNGGIAAALNDGVRRCLSDGRDVVITFDQDSRPRPDHVQLVTKVLALADGDPGIVGPGVVDDVPVESRGFLTTPQDVDAMIQSGMAIPSHTFARVGLFDESLFIDGVDTDFCLRVRSSGLRVLAVPDLSMAHGLGGQTGAARRFQVGRFSPAATHHDSERRYYINRNAVVLLRRHWRFSPIFALTSLRRLLVSDALALVLEPQRVTVLAVVLRGLGDGLRGRTGRAPSRDQPS